jgi:O-antigen/teichoic acid export membrane protein
MSVQASPESPSAYKRELFLNQLWQSANFLSKAGFLVLLTPLMLWKWGADRYGLFALASSLLVSMALLDGGVRALTRIRLANALKEKDEETFRRIYAEGLYTFILVVLLASAGAMILASTGGMTTLLRLPEGGAAVLVMTVLMTGVLMTTLLGLEPLAARGSLSILKAANTWGALAAVPICALAVWLGRSVGEVVFLYAACLIAPNLVVAARSGLLAHAPWKYFLRFGPRVAIRTLRDGAWYYLTTVSLVMKTHLLTFLVSALAGPAEAGIFYVLLRLSEVVGNVGATASETSLAALAGARSETERFQNFSHSWLYVAVFCLHGALVFALLGDQLIHLWLPGAELLPRGAGAALAAFGLAGAFSRVVVNAAMGLDITRLAALANLAEAMTAVILAGVGYHLGGLTGLLIGGSTGVVFLLPPAQKIARLCGRGFFGLYATPLLVLVPGLLGAGALQGAAGLSASWPVWGAALLISGLIALWQLRKVHAMR